MIRSAKCSIGTSFPEKHSRKYTHMATFFLAYIVIWVYNLLMVNVHNLELWRRDGMQFVKLSDTVGVNLDHLLEWWDDPREPEPMLVLTTIATSENEYGQRQPHEIKLYGQERLKMLHWLDQVNVDDDWKAAYEEVREEKRGMQRRLDAYQDSVTDEERHRIEEYAQSQEEIARKMAEEFAYPR
jgi:hypothetical protein